MSKSMEDLEESMKAIKKKYGDNVVQFGNEVSDVIMVPTDLPIVDYVTTGGIPVNRITEFVGDFSSLKSYISYTAIAKFQRFDWANNTPDVLDTVVKLTKGKLVPEVKKITHSRKYKPKNPPEYRYTALIDIEGTYVKSWGEHIGVDNDALIYANPSSLNSAIDLLDVLLRNPAISLIVFDSMIAIGADAEADESMLKEQMGVNARFWNKAIRKITAAINANKNGSVTLIMINGSYEKLGMVFGDPEKTKNGKGMELAKSMALKTSALKTQDETIGGVKVIKGRNITIRNRKNKVGIPFREGSFYFSYVDDGYVKAGTTDIVSQLVNLAVQGGLVSRAGAFYTYEGIKVQGFDNLCSKIVDDEELFVKLKTDVYEKIIKCNAL